jgi:hypothetical protein
MANRSDRDIRQTLPVRTPAQDLEEPSEGEGPTGVGGPVPDEDHQGNGPDLSDPEGDDEDGEEEPRAEPKS